MTSLFRSLNKLKISPLISFVQNEQLFNEMRLNKKCYFSSRHSADRVVREDKSTNQFPLASTKAASYCLMQDCRIYITLETSISSRSRNIIGALIKRSETLYHIVLYVTANKSTMYRAGNESPNRRVVTFKNITF